MKKYKVLVVDDDRQLAEIARINFPADQFSVQTVYSGEDALLGIDKDRPDLVILDVMMPLMDGWEVLQKMKANPATSGIPVIMCTAKDGIQDVEKSYRFGAQAYIIKPIQFERLIQKVGAILDIEQVLHDRP